MRDLFSTLADLEVSGAAILVFIVFVFCAKFFKDILYKILETFNESVNVLKKENAKDRETFLRTIARIERNLIKSGHMKDD